MEQRTALETSTPLPAQPASQPTPSPVQSQQPPQQKSHAWIWVLGGCLLMVILAFITFMVMGWFGFRAVKKEINKFEPGFKENIERMDKEREEWQKKSKDFRNSLPDPDKIQNQIPSME